MDTATRVQFYLLLIIFCSQFDIFKYSIKHRTFVYTQSNDQTVLFQTVQFNINTQIKCEIDPKIRWFNSGPEWTLEQCHWLCFSPKLQHYRSLAIRLFNDLSRTLVGGVIPLCRDAVGVFWSSGRLGHILLSGALYEGWSSLRCIQLKALPFIQHVFLRVHIGLLLPFFISLLSYVEFLIV